MRRFPHTRHQIRDLQYDLDPQQGGRFPHDHGLQGRYEHEETDRGFQHVQGQVPDQPRSKPMVIIVVMVVGGWHPRRQTTVKRRQAASHDTQAEPRSDMTDGIRQQDPGGNIAGQGMMDQPGMIVRGLRKG